jgi:hypothetical protein
MVEGTFLLTVPPPRCVCVCVCVLLAPFHVMGIFSSSSFFRQGRLFTCFICLSFGSGGHAGVWGVQRFRYELPKFFWRFLNEFAMIWMRYQWKILEIGNQPVQGRIDRQYGRLRHHSLGYLPSHVFILGK